jgi:hypothetical protein
LSRDVHPGDIIDMEIRLQAVGRDVDFSCFHDRNSLRRGSQ